MRTLTSSRVALPLLTLIISGCGGGSSAGNSAPVIADQSFTITEDSGSLEISLGATDKNGDSLTYSTATPATSGSTFWLDKINGIIEYYPAANFSGDDAFAVTVSDGELSATAQISITITAVNDAPSLTTRSISVRETQAVSGQLEASDAEGDSITFSLISAVPENATLTISNDGMYSYQNSTLPDSPVVVTVGLSDGNNNTTASLSFIHQTDPLTYQQ
ncbi:Ig-like domain-containing protein [Thalassolituus marinus]|uniref:Cadherin-like domain-containing protein n=1 Tax=Thalassolituus marinus TaxID=671053 RepID=A0ABS7ZNX1_9GAMM|nr:Ig-like domain-containing protein [Thalassolituus marinus]MCA6063402.1 cadherin-like domain-containing protein [Thalassolituus marinus]